MNILIRNISCGCMILIGITAIVTGAVFRKSYYDITQTTDYMDSMYVCEYQEGIVPDMTDDYIDRAAYVFVVEAYGYTKYMYQSICQKVKLVQVITGARVKTYFYIKVHGNCLKETSGRCRLSMS